ncbi:MAG: hypothetical protein WC606_05260 [Candidatus Absconditabacterales bacterium]
MNIKTIIKFIIFVAIFYALLAFNIFHIGENLVPSTKDYVETNTPQKNQDGEQTYGETDTTAQTGHFAANTTTDLESLCNSINICDKILFKGAFTDNEKYWYTKVVNKIIQFIDNNSNENKQIKEVINTIEINKENGSRRGYATRNTIIFNLGSVQSKKEFIELSTHEMGHITDLGYIQGSSSRKDKNYTEFGKVVFAIDDISLNFYKLSRDNETIRKSEAKQKDFCSGYGMSDPFEDVAECFNLYINHNSFFRQLAKTNIILRKKYNFIASIFYGQYVSSSNQDLTLIKNNISRRPRDTTKLTN